MIPAMSNAYHGGALVSPQHVITKVSTQHCEKENAECELFSLTTRFAGLGIDIPTETASSSYHTSAQSTNVVVEVVNDS